MSNGISLDKLLVGFTPLPRALPGFFISERYWSTRSGSGLKSFESFGSSFGVIDLAVPATGLARSDELDFVVVLSDFPNKLFKA